MSVKRIIMKNRALVWNGSSLLLIVALALGGCSDPKKVALRALEKKQYPYTTAGYLAAAAAGDTESVGIFHDLGMDVDAKDQGGDTALIRAAGAGRQQVVEQLLGFGADLHQKNAAERNALISAAAKGYDDIARLLVSRGADIETKDSEGWSALSIAAYNGHKNVVEMLSGQSDEESLNESLLLASFSGNVGVLEHLLGQGAYINVRSPEGQTPLMIASEQGNEAAVRALLQNHANPYSLDNDGKTAAILADNAGHGQVRDLILTPEKWGNSKSGEEIKAEMDSARLSFEAGGTQEMLKQEETPAKETEAEMVGNSSRATGGQTSPQGGAADAVVVVRQGAGMGKNERNTASSSPSDMDAGRKDKRANARSGGVGAGRSASTIPSSSVAMKRKAKGRLIKNSKSKPMVALNGSQIITRTPGQAVVGSMVLAGFREQPLPISLNDVNDGQAGIRRLDNKAEGKTVRVKAGRVIPGTAFRVKSVTKKFVSSKEGKGKLVDASRAVVEDTKTGSTYTLVRDTEGYSSDKYAVLTTPGSNYRYVVRTGDVFQTVEPGIGKVDHQVIDIRPDAVVIKNLRTQDVESVSRD